MAFRPTQLRIYRTNRSLDCRGRSLVIWKVKSLKKSTRGSFPKLEHKTDLIFSPEVQAKVAVVIHAFYLDEYWKILHHLKKIPVPYDLFVTTSSRGHMNEILNHPPSAVGTIVVYLFENRGRDIGPFLGVFETGALDGYSAVLKLHTKKSLYSDAGEVWQKTLLDGLLGNEASVATVLEAFANGKTGISGVRTQYLSNGLKYWGSNEGQVHELRKALGITKLKYSLGFFAGSMFWFSPIAMGPLKTLSTKNIRSGFAPEAGQRDGTLAHAIERVFCDVCASHGFLVSATDMPGTELEHETTFDHSIAVEKDFK